MIQLHPMLQPPLTIAPVRTTVCSPIRELCSTILRVQRRVLISNAAPGPTYTSCRITVPGAINAVIDTVALGLISVPIVLYSSTSLLYASSLLLVSFNEAKAINHASLLVTGP